MKKHILFFLLLSVAAVSVCSADNFILGLKFDFAGSGKSVSAEKIPSASYAVVDTAELYKQDSAGLIPKVGLDLGWEWDYLSLFGRANISTSNSSAYLLNHSISESYVSDDGSYRTYTAYDKIFFNFYEFDASLNVMFDWTLIGEEGRDFAAGLFASIGAGAEVSLDMDGGASKPVDWPSVSSSPSAISKTMQTYTGGKRPVVPFASADLGVNLYFKSSNPLTIAFGTDCYPMKRFTDSFYIQDTEGNAVKADFIEDLFRFRVSAGYTFRF